MSMFGSCVCFSDFIIDQFLRGCNAKAATTDERSVWTDERSVLLWGCNAAPAPGETPWFGSVAVYSRGKGQGHVGFVVGVDAAGRYLVLGGNQGDSVSVAALPALGKSGRGLECVALRLPWWCGRTGRGTGRRCEVLGSGSGVAAAELSAEAAA